MGSRISFGDFDTIDTCLQQLHIEEETSKYEMVYLVDSDGVLYSSDGETEAYSGESFVEQFLQGSERLATRLDHVPLEDGKAPMLLFGSAVSPFYIGDTEFIAVAAVYKVSDMHERLSIDSFDGVGTRLLLRSRAWPLPQLPRLKA